jgi:YYY domain-containing protein
LLSLWYALTYWLVLFVVGLLFVPLTLSAFRSFGWLSYPLARMVGLAVLTLAVWLLSFVRLVPHNGASTVIVCLATAAIVTAAGYRALLPAWASLRRGWRYAVVCELVFAAAFAGVCALRAYTPTQADSEKPFDYSVLNAVHVSRWFPPDDLWLAGHDLHYYYAGYVTIDALNDLSGTPVNDGMNLGFAAIEALTALALFGLGATVAAYGHSALRHRGLRIDREAGEQKGARSAAPPLLITALGLLTAGAGLLLGNLEGMLEFGALHNLNPPWLYDHAGIQTLQPYSSPFWWPDRGNTLAILRAARLGSLGANYDFPFRNLALGDLHAHVIDGPFRVLALFCALYLLLSLAERRPWGGREYVVTAVVLTLPVALCGGTNSWDLLSVGGVYGIAALFALPRARRDGTYWRALLPLAALALGLLLAAPIILGAGGGVHGILPTNIVFRKSFTQPYDHFLPFRHFLLYWLPLLLPALLFASLSAWRYRARLSRRDLALVVAVVLLLPFAWAITTAAMHGPHGLWRELSQRAWGWLTPLALGCGLGVCLLALLAIGREQRPSHAAWARAGLIALAAVAVAQVYLAEFFWVWDQFYDRADTTYHLYTAAWTLLAPVAAVGGAIALRELWSLRPQAGARRAAAPLLSAALVCTTLGALIYPVFGIFSATNGFSGPLSLDGLGYVKQSQPSQWGAALFLQRNRRGGDVLLEFGHDDYTPAGQLSEVSGMPTILGWTATHEIAERGPLPLLSTRQHDVDTLYTSSDPAVVLRLLRSYHVAYIAIGDTERHRYGAYLNAPVLAALGRLVYGNGQTGTSLYDVRGLP